MVSPYLYISQNINGTWESLSQAVKYNDLQNGLFSTTYTPVGSQIRFWFGKNWSSDVFTNTTCYVDNFKVEKTNSSSSQNSLIVIEENNYYPFGLKHKGYNELPQNASLRNPVAKKYKYQGQELEEDLGKNTYAYQWRDYDPAIGRFNKIDRFAEKYVEVSPYAFTKNNPILYREIAGDTIVDSDNIVRDYRTNITSQMTAIDEILADENFNYSAAGITRADVVKARAELSGVIDELDAMESSEQVYNVSFSSSMAKNAGAVSFNNSDNSVSIEVGQGSGLGIISQELLHGYQFQSGEISISYDNSAYGSLYDIGDETATYRREHLIVNGINGLATRQGINNAWTRSYGAQLSPPAYVGVPRQK